MPFCFDIETLGTESTSAILSFACCYYDGKELSFRKLLDNTFFVKIDVQDQIKRFGRTTDKNTMEWWSKQTPHAKKKSLIPSPDDVKTETALALFHKWISQKPDWQNDMVWVRGSLDHPVFESLVKATGKKIFIPYNMFRDVRTAVQCFYPNEKGGYVDVDLKKIPDFDPSSIFKHDPVIDVCLDFCMLFGGVTE